MKRALIVAAVAAAPLAWALANAQTATADHGARAAQGADPAAAAKESTSKTQAPAHAGSDPRVCLEFATNLEIHRCAEKYRPRKRVA